MRVIAVDFDGVIHKYSKGWHDGTIYDKPMTGAREMLEHLHKHYRIVIFTARPDIDGIAKWMQANEIPFDEITHEKPIAAVYIDDRAVHFRDWTTTFFELLERNILQ